jgi:hypothetical protein
MAVVSWGIEPMNQRSRAPSAVPVLPAAGRSGRLAGRPVPAFTTFWSIHITVSATSLGTARRGGLASTRRLQSNSPSGP